MLRRAFLPALAGIAIGAAATLSIQALTGQPVVLEADHVTAKTSLVDAIREGSRELDLDEMLDGTATVDDQAARPHFDRAAGLEPENPLFATTAAEIQPASETAEKASGTGDEIATAMTAADS